MKKQLFDQHFLVGVTKRSFLLGAVTFVFVLGLAFTDWIHDPEWALFFQRLAFGFGAGAIASILSFETLRNAGTYFLSVKQGDKNSSVWKNTFYTVLLVLKFPLLITYIYFVLSADLFHAVGLLVGLGLPQFIISLQGLGFFLTGGKTSSGDSDPSASERINRATSQ